MEKVPFLVRRARLLLGETQMQFAERFGVEDGTVSRWERGKLRPHPQALKQMRKIVIREGSFLSDALIRASHLAKIVTPMNDLTRALVVSEGVKDALKQAGVSHESLSSAIVDPKEARTSPHYKESAVRALELIQADPRWLKGGSKARDRYRGLLMAVTRERLVTNGYQVVIRATKLRA
jgi:transcriptional regulator with XRE-family HTH domain